MKPSSRRGFTLIELLAVMGVFTVITVLLAMFLSAILQAQRQTQLRDRQRMEYARLDGILRADVHAATKVVVDSPIDCELQDDQGGRWTYRREEAGLVRERWLGDQLRQREVFYLRPGMKVLFGTRTENERTLLELELDLPISAHRLQPRQQPYAAVILVGGALATADRSPEDQP